MLENEGLGESCPSSNNPINLINGNKYKVYTDIDPGSETGIRRPGFTRYYNSQLAEKFSTIGNKWTHTYDRRMYRLDALKTGQNVKLSTGGKSASAYQSSVYSSRQSACESGIHEIRAQAQGLEAGPYRNLQAFLNAEARWQNDECRIYVNGRFRAVFPIFTHGGVQGAGNAWDQHLGFYRPDGNVVRFSKLVSGNAQFAVISWKETTDAGYALDELDVTPAVPGGDITVYRARYVLTDPNHIRETYDRFGKLLHIDYPDGVRETLSYQDSRITGVENSLGQSIDIRYNADGYIASVSDESDRVWRYRYLDGNLVELVNPDLTSIEYHYEDSNFPGGLTGITDERGVRISTFAYYSDGLARSSYLGRPGASPELRIENVNVTYGALSNTVTNSRGFQSTYYAEDALQGLLLRYDGPECADCPNGSKHYDYDPETRDLLRRSEYGRITLFEDHDINGNPGTVVKAAATPEQRITTYTYDSRFPSEVRTRAQPSVFEAGTRVTSFRYDDSGKLASTTTDGFRPDGASVSRSQSWLYEGPYRQLSAIDGPRTDVDDSYSFAYYPDHTAEGSNRARLRSVTAPLGIVLYDDITYTSTGKLASYITAAGLRADFTYYPGNERLEKQTFTDIISGESRAIHWNYLATGEIAAITLGYATPDAATLTFGYDDARRLTRIYDGLDNYVEFVMDTEGNVVNENIYDGSNVLRKSLKRTFDARNRLDISEQVNETVDLDFSPAGTLARQRKGNNVITDYGYDALNRLISITRDVGGADPSSADALTRVGYDAQDNIVSVTDPNGGLTSYSYDDLGNLISMTSPDTGTKTYTYDEAGNLMTMKDARGHLFAYRHDALGRVISADAPGDADDIAYEYDACVNGVGRLCSVSRGGILVSYDYTAFGEVRSLTQTVDVFPGYEQAAATVTFAYDAAGRVRDMVYPSGNKVTYTYDGAGNVFSVVLNDGEQNLVASASYYPFGSEQHIVRGNGSSIFGHMDQAYRTFIKGNGSYYFDVIFYDANGNPATFYSKEGTKVHGYDALDRLRTSSGPYGSRSYGYDANGNRIGKVSDGVTDDYGYDAGSNRMNAAAGGAVVLDANGNATEMNGLSIAYTSDNRVAGIAGRAAYTYNGLGERVIKAARGPGTAAAYGYTRKTVFVYGQNGNLLAELGPSGQVKQEYIYMNQELLALLVYQPTGSEPILNADMDEDGVVGVDDFRIWYFTRYRPRDISGDVNSDGLLDISDIQLVLGCARSGGTATGCMTASYGRSIYYAHNDHLGSPHLLSDESGISVWSAMYDPFGEATINEDLDADGNKVKLNFRFPGQYYDAESGLHYNYFRYYDPSIGRYISSDPIGLFGGLNTYSYVENNPLVCWRG